MRCGRRAPPMYHCRRRLWRRTIPSAAAAAPQALAPAAPARAPTAPAEEPRRAASSAPELRETVREEVPGISLAREAERLLAPEWTVGCLPVDVLLEATGAVEVEAGPWLRAPGPGGDRGGRTASREIMSRIPLPKGGPMMPTTTRSKDAYSVEVCGEGAEVASICIDITIDLLDVPYGDCFLIKERILLEATTDGTGVVVSKAYALKFRKRTLVQGVIEMNSVGSQEKSGAALVAFLQRRGAPATPAPQATIVEAWELQRRVTLFHQTWEAPFLPHDGEKSCRWVDHHFRQHPWAQGITWVASALAGRPPLRPPGGWPEHSLGWSVAQAPSGPCDEDGWQYGFDFYTDPAVWGQPAELSHCRRRLWRCSLSQPPTPGRQVVSCPEEKQSAEAPGLGTIWMVLVALPLLLLPGLAAGRPGGALAGAGPEWTLRFPGGGAEQAEEVRVKAHCLKEMGACEVMNCTAEGEGRGAKMDLAWAADVVGS
ncbi:unnamed protein product [Prorocentrum cordatum]|uniref:VASt domain-containing protein n=1 Tax=Prorocentrum cordatum TaxID=2364126 RepID=A0ABN9RVR4_9DINO|nr:unnamed protein product [Polarella glacialis]